MTAQVCTPWLDAADLCCAGAEESAPCDGSDPVAASYPATDEQYVLAASNLLYARTGYRYPGTCSAMIWPCVDQCAEPGYPCSSCCAPDQVELPVTHAVVGASVVIEEDGVAVDPNTYRLERKRFVVRTDGSRFTRNNFGIGPGTETVISYDYGSAPPPELVLAAHDLACELKRACSGDLDCKLPPNVRRVARQGLAIEMVDLQRMLTSDKTGIPTVDHALAVHSYEGGTLFGDPAAGPHGWGVL